jgi:hypothetical protein
VKTIGKYVAIGGSVFVLFFAASFAKDWWDRRNEPAFRKDADTAATGTAAATGIAAKADTVYLQGETVYIRTRDALLNPGAGKPPASPEVKACFAAAEDLRSKCEVRHTADLALSDSLRKELKVWQNRPIPGVPRVHAFGEALYDFAHTVPVIRAGATARIPFISALSLSVAGEYAAPPANESKPTFRALAGVRVTF